MHTKRHDDEVENQASQTKGELNQSSTESDLTRMSALVGHKVFDEQAEALGDIKEIVLDLQSGQVAYIVLSFGGFLGMGTKLFAVPWGSLKFDTLNKRLMLHIDKERLKGAPGFDKNNWPDMADPMWVRQINDYYKI